ncbi:MAG: phage tail tape measure protein [Xanthomonadaceae bacterium]|nr:phage tail tape measure protein [Xanthomonadaceae bacterium]
MADAKGAKYEVVFHAIDKVGGPVQKMAGAVEALGKRVEKSLAPYKSLAEPLGRIGEKIGELLPMIGALSSVASVSGLVDLAVTAAESGEQLSLAAQKTGLAVDAFQKLSYAAMQTGVAGDSFSTSMFRLNQRLATAASGHNKMFAADLGKLGIAMKDSSGHMRGTDAVLADMAEKFKLIKDPQQQAAFVMEAFGRAGKDMIPFLELGADGIRKLEERFTQVGYLRNETTLGVDEKFIHSWHDLTTAASGFTTEVGDKLTPILMPVVDDMTKWVAANRDWISSDISGLVGKVAGYVGQLSEKNVEALFKTWGDDIEAAWKKMKPLFDDAMKIIDALPHLDNAKKSIQHAVGTAKDVSIGAGIGAAAGAVFGGVGAVPGAAIGGGIGYIYSNVADGVGPVAQPNIGLGVDGLPLAQPLPAPAAKSDVTVRFVGLPPGSTVESSTTGGAGPRIVNDDTGQAFGDAWWSVTP